ncbi:nucleotide exchange factor GrpE [Yinghuangia sp. ASG 101]|uniref:nucleotide exchange factor GrpE n=1 Tax=Yinghuangia sp. ASG 101 TaxID=2896848 RepID=UPI001E60BAFB|nr:nucleotide exchange factor GrpE [Yinghuangia sp. ASG 101]UGQ15111.1 nucleotide exchange factor GrpE [Yinghuangia sp. ASG 101]
MTEGTHGFPEEPVIRDKRRIDPETGEVRSPAPDGGAREGGPGPAGSGGVSSSAELESVRGQLAERTLDLQRLQAEYSNYRKRVERDRQAAGELAIVKVLTDLLPVLDDIGRARDHGELSGGFKSVAESLESALAKMGLQSFGKKGEPFDPVVHEALLHSYAPDVTEPTCVEILQPGYQFRERVIRPARVAVAEPAEAGEPPAAESDTT